MNAGNQVRKLVRFNFISLIKRTLVSQVSGGGKHKSIISPFLVCGTNVSDESTKIGSSSLMYNANICLLPINTSNLSIRDVMIRNSIAEPVPVTEMNVGLPFSGLVEKDLKLPGLEKRELIDPISNVIKKQARKNLMRIRKRKMRRHKWKKLQKKMKFKFAKLRRRRKEKREREFVNLLNSILDSGKNYNPESEVKKNLELLSWKRPVTRVRGYLAPKSVVEDYLKKEEIQAQINQKVEECLKKLS